MARVWQFKPMQQSRQQMLRAYYPNIYYTVPPAQLTLSWTKTTCMTLNNNWKIIMPLFDVQKSSRDKEPLICFDFLKKFRLVDKGHM